MKQLIPFTKDITFKTKVSEITSISLDHDLQLKGEDLITGNFYIKGTFKMTKASQIEEDFNYKIPCDIAISDEYDTFDAIIDIDDFYYDLLDESILKVNIAVAIDNLKKAEREVKEQIDTQVKEDNIIINYEDSSDRIDPINMIKDIKEDIFFDKEDNYQTYYVYLVKEEDTLLSITEKYHITKEDILKYNELTDVKAGMKLIIPEVKYE